MIKVILSDIINPPIEAELWFIIFSIEKDSWFANEYWSLQSEALQKIPEFIELRHLTRYGDDSHSLDKKTNFEFYFKLTGELEFTDESSAIYIFLTDEFRQNVWGNPDKCVLEVSEEEIEAVSCENVTNFGRFDNCIEIKFGFEDWTFSADVVYKLTLQNIYNPTEGFEREILDGTLESSVNDFYPRYTFYTDKIELAIQTRTAKSGDVSMRSGIVSTNSYLAYKEYSFQLYVRDKDGYVVDEANPIVTVGGLYSDSYYIQTQSPMEFSTAFKIMFTPLSENLHFIHSESGDDNQLLYG